MRTISTSKGCRSFKSVDCGLRPNASETSLPAPANFPLGEDHVSSASRFVFIFFVGFRRSGPPLRSCAAPVSEVISPRRFSHTQSWAGNRTDCDRAAPVGLELLYRFLGCENQAENVQVELPVEMLLRHFLKREKFVNARIVDQDVERAERFLRLGKQAFDVRLL